MSINKIDLIEYSTFLRDGTEEPEAPEFPVLVTARFEALDNGTVALQVSGNNVPHCFITIIHEGREAAPPQVIKGDQTAIPIFVRDAESVMILARHQGAVIANALLEIRPALIESIDKLANPSSTFNIIVEQVNMAHSERRIAREPRRQSPDPDETIMAPAVKIGGIQ
jgi:hypothetical protein